MKAEIEAARELIAQMATRAQIPFARGGLYEHEVKEILAALGFLVKLAEIGADYLAEAKNAQIEADQAKREATL